MGGDGSGESCGVLGGKGGGDGGGAGGSEGGGNHGHGGGGNGGGGEGDTGNAGGFLRPASQRNEWRVLQAKSFQRPLKPRSAQRKRQCSPSGGPKSLGSASFQGYSPRSAPSDRVDMALVSAREPLCISYQYQELVAVQSDAEHTCISSPPSYAEAESRFVPASQMPQPRPMSFGQLAASVVNVRLLRSV